MQLRHAPTPFSCSPRNRGESGLPYRSNCVTAVRTNVIAYARDITTRSGRRLVRDADQSLMRGQIQGSPYQSGTGTVALLHQSYEYR